MPQGIVTAPRPFRCRSVVDGCFATNLSQYAYAEHVSRLVCMRLYLDGTSAVFICIESYGV